MFKLKSAEDIEKMTDAEAKQYREEYNQYLEAMKSDLDKATKELAESKKNQVSKGEVDTLKSTVSDLKTSLDKAEKALVAQGIEMAKVKVSEVGKSTLATIKDQLTANIEKLKELKNNKIRFDFTIKAVGTMTTSASLTGQIATAMTIPGFNPIASRQPFIGQLINNGTTSSPLIQWVEEVAGEGDAGLTAEGVAKNQMDVDFKLVSEAVRKITVYVKISEEMLEDIDFMASAINTKLLQKLELKIDQQILAGTAGGVQLNGIYTQATAFAAGSFALAVVTPNLFDVIKVAINQIAIANHNANFIVVHPSDAVALSLTKDGNKGYLFPTFNLPNGKTVDGIPVITNTGIGIGNMLVGDFSKASVYFKDAVRIEMGYDADDFTKNLRTVLAEARLALVIEGNDKTAFVKGVISACVTAITKA